MANILTYLGARLFGDLPAGRKRERKKTQVNTRDYWSGTTTTLETDDTFASVGTPMEELVSDEAKAASESAAVQEDSIDDAAVTLQQDVAETAGSDAAALQQGAADEAACQGIDKEAADVAGQEIDMEAADAAEQKMDTEAAASAEIEDGMQAVTTTQENAPADRFADSLSAEDALLGQIEQFRQQARRLQQLMQDKENRAKELESLVEQRSDQADELEQLVAERTDKADELEQLVAQREEAAKGVTEEVVKRLDSIYYRMETRIDQAEENIRGDILDGVRVDTAHSQQLSDTVASQGRQLDGVQQAVADVAGDAKEIYTAVEAVAANASKAADNTDELRMGIEGLSGKTAEIAGNLTGVRTEVEGISGNMAGLKSDVEGMNAGVLGMTASVTEMSASVEHMAGGLEGISANVDGLPEKISNMTESIHSESVMNYRNTANLIKEVDDRLDQLEALKKEAKGTRKIAVCAMIFAILTFLAAAGGTALSVMSMLGLL